MTTTLRWIGALPSALQAGIDRAVSAELHAIASDISRSRLAGRATHATEAAACVAEANCAAPGQIAA
jgi:hypothetical protein